jgi:hypothetical protein
MQIFLNWLNTALMINIFLVLFSFAWLVVATIGELNHIPLGLQLWYKLWEPVFTPAIGILMAGALTTGLLGWLQRRFRPDSE